MSKIPGGSIDRPADVLLFKEKGGPEKPAMRNRISSPSLIAIMVVNPMCIVTGSPALGASNKTFTVLLKEPTGAVVVIGNGFTGPEAAFVEIL